MTLFDAFVIYLSAGAPFGVLAFLNRQNERYSRTAADAVIAVGFWPILAATRLGRAATWLHPRSQTNLDRVNDSSGIQDRDRGAVDQYTVLSDIADTTPDEPAELFEVAGHPNPWLATNCYTRSRRKVVLSHIDRLETVPLSTSEDIDLPRVHEYPARAVAVIRS